VGRGSIGLLPGYLSLLLAKDHSLSEIKEAVGTNGSRAEGEEERGKEGNTKHTCLYVLYLRRALKSNRRSSTKVHRNMTHTRPHQRPQRQLPERWQRNHCAGFFET